MCGRIGLVVLLIGLVFLGAGSVAQETGVKVSITAPVDRSVTAETKVQVEGMASTTAPGDSIFIVLVVVNGVAQKAELGNDGKFKSTVNLMPGENVISAIAVTKNREVASAKVSVTMNPQPRVVFFDNFNDSPRPEWSSTAGNWVTINGQYTVGEDVTCCKTFGSLVDIKKPLQAFAIDVDLRFGRTASGTYPGVEAYIYVRAQDINNGIVLSLMGKSYQIEVAQWRVRRDGRWTEPIGETRVTTKAGEVVHVRIEVNGIVYRAYVNEKEVAQISFPGFPNATNAGLGLWYQAWYPGERTTFDNFKVESTDAKARVEPPSTPEQPQQPTLPPQPPVAVDLEPRVASLESQVSYLQGAVAQVSARVDKIESQLPAVSPGVPVEFEQRLSTLERLVGNVDVGGLSKELATVKITVASLSADHTRFKQDLDQLKQALPSSNIEGHLAQIQQSLDSLSQKVEDSNQKLAAAESSARLALIAGATGVALALLVVSGVIR